MDPRPRPRVDEEGVVLRAAAHHAAGRALAGRHAVALVLTALAMALALVRAVVVTVVDSAAAVLRGGAEAGSGRQVNVTVVARMGEGIVMAVSPVTVGSVSTVVTMVAVMARVAYRKVPLGASFPEVGLEGVPERGGEGGGRGRGSGGVPLAVVGVDVGGGAVGGDRSAVGGLRRAVSRLRGVVCRFGSAISGTGRLVGRLGSSVPGAGQLVGRLGRPVAGRRRLVTGLRCLVGRLRRSVPGAGRLVGRLGRSVGGGHCRGGAVSRAWAGAPSLDGHCGDWRAVRDHLHRLHVLDVAVVVGASTAAAPGRDVVAVRGVAFFRTLKEKIQIKIYSVYIQVENERAFFWNSRRPAPESRVSA